MSSLKNNISLKLYPLPMETLIILKLHQIRLQAIDQRKNSQTFNTKYLLNHLQTIHRMKIFLQSFLVMCICQGSANYDVVKCPYYLQFDVCA